MAVFTGSFRDVRRNFGSWRVCGRRRALFADLFLGRGGCCDRAIFGTVRGKILMTSHTQAGERSNAHSAGNAGMRPATHTVSSALRPVCESVLPFRGSIDSQKGGQDKAQVDEV
jgi:hypothetical protein